MHDHEKKCIIPFAEFVTTSHNQNNIAQYLSNIKFKLEQNSGVKLPDFIVTDMSWALINAVMQSFNNCQVENYLNWCFDYIYEI